MGAITAASSHAGISITSQPGALGFGRLRASSSSRPAPVMRRPSNRPK
jgi:hypothetical protein